MEIINLPRGDGKTTYAIIEAMKTGYPIITMNGVMKRELERYVKKFYGEDIVVYTISEFCDDNFWRGRADKKPEKVIIDELPLVLSQILGCDCKMATMTGKYYGHRNYGDRRTKDE